MFEHNPPGNGVWLRAAVDSTIGKVRVDSSDGGVALSSEEARDLADRLDMMADELEVGE